MFIDFLFGGKNEFLPLGVQDFFESVKIGIYYGMCYLPSWFSTWDTVFCLWKFNKVRESPGKEKWILEGVWVLGLRKKIQFTREVSGEVQARETQADPAGEEVQPHGAPVQVPVGSPSATGPHKRQQTWQGAFWKRDPNISKQLNWKQRGRRPPPWFWHPFPPDRIPSVGLCCSFGVHLALWCLGL